MLTHTCQRCAAEKPVRHCYRGPHLALRGLCRDCALVVRRLDRERQERRRRWTDGTGPLSLRQLHDDVRVHDGDHAGGGPVG